MEKPENPSFARSAKEGWAAARPPKDARVRAAWRVWREKRRDWRQHALEPGVFYPSWAILLAILMIGSGILPLMDIWRHWSQWREAGKALIAMNLGVSALCFFVGPFEMLRRGRRLCEIRREYVHARDPEWAGVEQTLRGEERAAREAFDIARAISDLIKTQGVDSIAGSITPSGATATNVATAAGAALSAKTSAPRRGRRI